MHILNNSIAVVASPSTASSRKLNAKPQELAPAVPRGVRSGPVREHRALDVSRAIKAIRGEETAGDFTGWKPEYLGISAAARAAGEVRLAYAAISPVAVMFTFVSFAAASIPARPLTDPGSTHLDRNYGEGRLNPRMPSLMSQPPRCVLVSRRDDGFGDVYPLQDGVRYKLGRADQQVMLSDLCSREHAGGVPRLRTAAGMCDLGSLNGTHVNGEAIRRERSLRPLDESASAAPASYSSMNSRCPTRQRRAHRRGTR